MKYHVNNDGVPGRCGATVGTCPFGGDAQHYASAELAQKAFELSMAAHVIPESSKAVGKKPFDASSAKYDRPPYPIEGDTVVVSPNASAHSAAFRSYEGQLGTVRDFNGTSYSVEFPSGATVSGLHYSLISSAPDDADGWPSLEAHREAIGKMSIVSLEDEAVGIEESSMPKAQKAARLQMVREAEDAYHVKNYGFTKNKLAFDESSVKADIMKSWKSSIPLTEERLEKALASRKAQWEAEALTVPASSYEKNIPIRLIPVGSEVHLLHKALSSRGRLYGKVGTPQDNGPEWDSSTQAPTGKHDVVGRYRDVAGEWGYVSPNTTFDLGYVPQGKALSPRWNEANAEALKLSEAREQYARDRRSPRAF